MSPEKEFYYQQLAANLLLYAVDGPHGRDELDEVYIDVTEGRDGPSVASRQKYSSCADLAHWLYYRLGVRTAWINRKEHDGWIVGVNLNCWVGRPIGPNQYATKPTVGYDLWQKDLFSIGDVVVVDNKYGGHVMVVQAYEPPGMMSSASGAAVTLPQLYTADYGQPGGLQKRRQVTSDGSGVRVGGNLVIAHVRMLDVLRGELARENLASPDVDVLEGYQAPEALEALRQGLQLP
jgi:hypothetical protein